MKSNTEEQFFYVIKGDPLSKSTIRSTNAQRIWSTQYQEKFSWSLQLANQHEGKAIFSGPIHLDISFFVLTPNYPAAKRKGITDGKPHFYLPKLSSFMEFLEQAGMGVLWNDPCIIASITQKKEYSHDPRTEFTIVKLKR